MGGKFWYHSIDEVKLRENRAIRWLIIDSQIMINISIIANREIYYPKEEIIFHERNGSG